MEKEITVYFEQNEFAFPSKVMGRRVLKDVHPQFNFWIHKSITDGYMFSVSEGSCGYAVGHGLTEKTALKNARSQLTKHPISVVRNIINSKIEFINNCKQNFLNDPLWNALSCAGYTTTQSELADIRQSLAADGYEITKIVSSLK